MKALLQTPSQTVGPFFAYGLCPEQYGYPFQSILKAKLVDPLQSAEAITISGKVYDGEGVVIPDAMVEIWQNDGAQQLFGRCGTGTDLENRFIFHTLKPAATEGQAPFLSVILFMRGQLIHCYTRLYFSDEQALNQNDALLSTLPEDRRATLIAQKTDRGYTFDIHMQGKKETVFLDI
jgi:protocatechuate 3,4-dioxygenase alpha subunit